VAGVKTSTYQLRPSPSQIKPHLGAALCLYLSAHYKFFLSFVSTVHKFPLSLQPFRNQPKQIFEQSHFLIAGFLIFDFSPKTFSP